MQALVVVLLGDSVTEVSACAFHRRLADTYTLTVSGTGGARADQRERDAAVLALERPDRVIINLGTNDVFQGTPPARTIAALTRIATAFRCARRIHLVTVTEGVFADGSPVLRARSVALNQRIATLAAAHGWGVIPWHDIVRRYRDAGEPLGPVTSDTIHPSPLGQWLLADTYARALAPCTRADPSRVRRLAPDKRPKVPGAPRRSVTAWADKNRISQHGGMNMATTQGKSDGAARLIDTIQDAENHSLEAVHKFLDTVDGAFPDLSHDNDGPRRKIIDSAFKMTEQLVGASNDLARTVLDLTETAMKDSDRKTATSKK